MASSLDGPPVITIGGYGNALAVGRSLGRRRVRVYAVGAGSGVRYSRFVRQAGAAGRPEPEAWLEWLMSAEAGALAGAVLFPCIDEALELIIRNRTLLAPRYTLMPLDDEVSLAMLDKAKTYELANRIGVPAPKVWPVNDRRGLLELIPDIPFPCALKPRHGHLFRKQFGLMKLWVARDADELLEHFRAFEETGLGSLVTEIIPGRDDQYVSYWTYVDDTGRSLFHFTKRKVRQYPIHFGLGTLHVTESNSDVAALGDRFVRDIGLKGFAAVEFKRDVRDGRFKLIECNARLVAAHEIAERSGIELSLLLYNHLTGRRLPQCDRFQSGVRLWCPMHDVYALRQYRQRGELSILEWLRTVCPSHISQFQWADPGPGLVLAASVLRSWTSKRSSGIRWSADRKPASGSFIS
jgi:predicted ATP-grasp superfamily ATP-dependent carboligase